MKQPKQPQPQSHFPVYLRYLLDKRLGIVSPGMEKYTKEMENIEFEENTKKEIEDMEKRYG